MMRKYVIVAILVIICTMLISCSAGETYYKNSFTSLINCDTNLNEGVCAIYEADSKGVNNFNERLTQTKNRLIDLLSEKGYDAMITTEGKNKLRVEVPDGSVPSSIFEFIGKPCQVVFVVEDKVVMNAKDKLTSANPRFSPQDGTYLVELDFTSEGKNEFGSVTSANVNKQMSIYLSYDPNIQVGDTITDYSDNVQLVTTANINEAIYGNATITGNFAQEDVENLATQITSGTFELALRLVKISTIPESNILGFGCEENGMQVFGLVVGLCAIMFAFIKFSK